MTELNTTNAPYYGLAPVISDAMRTVTVYPALEDAVYPYYFPVRLLGIMLSGIKEAYVRANRKNKDYDDLQFDPASIIVRGGQFDPYGPLDPVAIIVKISDTTAVMLLPGRDGSSIQEMQNKYAIAAMRRNARAPSGSGLEAAARAAVADVDIDVFDADAVDDGEDLVSDRDFADLVFFAKDKWPNLKILIRVFVYLDLKPFVQLDALNADAAPTAAMRERIVTDVVVEALSMELDRVITDPRRTRTEFIVL